MPLLVILIAIVMPFKIGEFTALLAIIAYAFVPAIRYAEHGLRNLPHEVLEAARTRSGARGACETTLQRVSKCDMFPE